MPGLFLGGSCGGVEVFFDPGAKGHVFVEGGKTAVAAGGITEELAANGVDAVVEVLEVHVGFSAQPAVAVTVEDDFARVV